MAKVGRPCIDICKFRRPGPAGKHCIACSMTKAQRVLSKRAQKGAEVDAFLALLLAQQAAMGRYGHWREAYLARCRKEGRRVARPVRSAG
jgi:hypothetical protein